MWLDGFRQRRHRPDASDRELAPASPASASIGSCWVSAHITTGSRPVRLMRRTLMNVGAADSGWQFFSGDEADTPLSDARVWLVRPLALVADCDGAITPYLHFPRGSELLRAGESFVPTPASVYSERDYFH